MGNVTISDSFIYIKDGEVWIKNMKVAKYSQSHPLTHHDENRDKKLLLKRKEINKIEKQLQDKGTTAIPLSIFVNGILIFNSPLLFINSTSSELVPFKITLFFLIHRVKKRLPA